MSVSTTLESVKKAIENEAHEEIVGQRTSPFLLDDTLNDNKKIVIIGHEIDGIKYTDEEASTIFITGNLLYNQLREEDFRKDPRKEGDVLLVPANNLLLDNIIVIERDVDSEEYIFNSDRKVNIGKYEIVWPINKELLDWYDPLKINKMLSISPDDPNEPKKLIVKLELTLKGDNCERFKTHTIKKIYSISEDKDNSNGKVYKAKQKQLPFLALWPYTKLVGEDRINKWNSYNFFYVEGIEDTIKINLIFEGGEGTLTKSGKLLAQNKNVNNNYHSMFYEKSTTLPTALELAVYVDKKGEIVLAASVNDTNDNPEYAGIVLLEKPREIAIGNATWDIGLDFGTTTTTAFYSGEDEKQHFIHLLEEYKQEDRQGDVKDRRVILKNREKTVLVNTNDKNRMLGMYFIDDECLQQEGYLSAYEKMCDGDCKNIFENGRVFWQSYESFKKANVDGRRRDLDTNLKWGNHNQINMQRYLTQIMTQIFYEAVVNNGVNKINWYFSYPTAFGSREIRGFGESIADIIDQLRIDGVTITSVTRDNENNNNRSFLISESTAAAIFFKNKPSKPQTFICVDIGGGTSDISVFIRGKNFLQTSVRFASRDMFIAPLKELMKDTLVYKRVSGDVKDPINVVLDAGGDDSGNEEDRNARFIHRLETVLLIANIEFKSRLTEPHSNYQDIPKKYQKFQESVFIAYAGLVYYLANTFIALLNEDKTIENNDVANIILGLSGKGSKLIDWIPNVDEIYKEVQDLIKKETEKTVVLNQDIDSGSAKTETAKGLLFCRSGERIDAKPRMLLGCDIEVSMTSKSRTNFITQEGISAFRGFESLNLSKDIPELYDFIAFFNRIEKRIYNIDRNYLKPLDIEKIKTIQSGLAGEIQKSVQQAFKGSYLDPPFIIMLNEFLKKIINSNDAEIADTKVGIEKYYKD